MSKVFTFTTSYVLPVLLTIGVLFGVFLSYVSAQPLPQINYQGKLTEPSGVAVADGSYNMRFYLYNATGGATTTAIWTETRTGGNAVTVTDGLFSVMLGSVNPGPGVNFNQPLYLGVEIGGSGAIAWDGEMTPRKELGTVPAAFQAYELGGVASSSFLRSDEADTLSASTATALLTLEQTGSGNILDVLNSVGSTTFTILENGSIGIGTDTPVGALNLDKGWGLSNGLTFGDGDTGISESANDSLSYVASIHSFSGQVRVGNGSASSPALSVGNTSMGLFAETPGGNDNLFFATEGLARMVINNAGNVGVGTTSPYAKLSVDGDLALTSGLYDSSATRGTNGQILQTTGSATRWVATSSLGFGTGDGTVTSVALSAPTGFTVSGSPVTSAGTLALSYAAGFEGLRTASSTNWNTFYTNPSSRITAGSNLAWSGNTLNATYAGAAGGWSVFNGTDVAISNSAAETTTFSTSIPSNLLNGDGQEISFTAVGTYVNTTGGNTNHTLRFKVNGTTVYADVTGNISSNAIGRPLTITGKIIRTSPTTAKIVADVKLANAGSATTGSGDYGATSVRTISSISTNASWNWSATTTFASTIQLSSAAASHTYTHDFISMNVNGEVDSTSLFTDAGDTTYLTSLTDKLAIGTTSATRLLEVYGAANAGGRFIDSTNQVTVDVRAEDFQGFMGTVSNNDLRFLTNNISRMVLDTDGDFSIGTTSNLTARFNVQTTGTNDILNLFETGGSEVLTVQEDGNVGIGTTTPTSKLSVVGDVSVFGGAVTANAPTNPTLTGTFNTSGFAAGVTIAGRYAYVADDAAGLQIIDISDPTNPTLTGTFNTSGFAGGVTLAGRYAYVADDAAGLQIIDISDPTNPTLTGTFNTSGFAGGVTLAGRYAYVADDAAGLQIIDINGSNFSSLFAGALGATQANVESNLIVGNNTIIGDGLNVGTDAFVQGTLSVGGTASSTLVGAPQLFVGANGVGIGTTTPNAKLSVAGNISATGTIAAGGGSAAAPALTFNDDMDTGMYQPSSNSIGFTNGGSQAFRILGTSDAYLSAGKAFLANGNAGSPTFSFENDNNTGIYNPFDNTIAFSVGGNERLRLVNNGNLGIGTTSPASKLDVWGDFRVGTNGTPTLLVDTATNQVILADGSNASPSLRFDGNSLVGFYQEGGNLRYAINATNYLEFGAQLSSSFNGSYSIRHDGISAANPTYSFNSDDDTGIFRPGANALALSTGGSERLRVNSSGNVGIGTTTPNSKLTIQQSADNNGFSLRGFDNESNEGLDMLVDSAGGVYLDIVGLTGFGYLSQGASVVAGWNASRFGLADDKELSVGDSTDYSLGYDSISDSFRIVDGDDVATNVRLAILSNGNIGIGTTTPSARLSLQNNTLSGAGVSGLDQLLTTTNSVASAVQFGNRFNLNANNTATTTIVGSIYRVADDTSFGNTVRGLEVQTNRGANTQGENTALSGFARTFGVRGVTSADAGGSFEPAGGFFETEGTTQGNAIRGYSGSITTATLLSLFQDTSAFTGTGLEMNFGNTTGSFSSSSSKYLDFQNGGSSVFTVSAFGTTTIGDGTTNNMAGLQIGYGGLCVDNDGTCNASTTGRITSVESFTGNSDLAEMYFSNQSLTPGELVTMAGDLSVVRAVEDASLPILGVVSTKPGLTLGFDDTSTRRGERGFPIALSGRVPVQLSTENGPIKKGDRLMLSSLPGIAMKATGTGMTVGIALEDFNENRKYSDTYLNQFGDDMVDPVYEPVTTNDDPRIHDGCYYGGGAAAGEAPCVPLKSTSTAGQIQEVNQQLAAESVAAQIQQLKRVGANTRRLATGESVKVGQVVMFVENSWRWLDEDQLAMVNSLMSTSSITEIGENEDETLLDRLVSLANRFVDGVFSVFELRADRVEVAEELCVDGVCIDADDLRTMLEQNNAPRNESSSPQDQSGNTDSESDGSGDSSNGGGSDSAANDSSDNGTVNPENQIDTQASPTPASSTASTTQSHDTPTSGATSTSNNTTPSTATEITQDSSGATEEVDTSASTNEPSTSTTQENQSDNDSATDETVAPEAVEELDSSESAGDTAGSANE